MSGPRPKGPGSSAGGRATGSPGARAAESARRRWAAAAFRGGAAGLVLLALVEATLRIIGHDDLWWNLATGRWIARHLRVPTVDLFSHTFAGEPWVNPEWLSHLLFYAVYRHLGENWIVYLRGALIALVFGVALALTLRRSRSWLISLTLTALGAWVCQPFLDARPQLFTFLLSILLLLILDLFRRRGRDLLLLLPILLLAWTQLHGGYIFGLLVLAGNVAAESVKRLAGLPADPLSWRQIRKLAAVTAISTAAVAINPWTVHAYTHPLGMSKLLGDSVFLTVAEWLPPEFVHRPEAFNPGQFWLFLLLAALAVLPIAIVRWRSFDLNDVGLAAVLALVFALQHRRFIPLFVILTLPLLGHALAFWADRLAGGGAGSGLLRSPDRRLRRMAAGAAVGCWLLFALLAPGHLLRARSLYAGDSLFRVNVHASYYPERAVDFLGRVPMPGRMFNLYNWGGYLEFFLPASPTFIDGRAQMAFGEDLYLDYLEAHSGGWRWREILDRYEVGWALLHATANARLLEAMIADPGWKWIFGHGDSAVLVREGVASRGLLERFRRGRLPLPETAQTSYLYGLDAEERGEMERAVEAFRRAAALDPEDDASRARLILALSATGRPQEARATALEAARELPASAPIRLAAARVEARAGRPAAAFRMFGEVLDRWPERLEAVDDMVEADPGRARELCQERYRIDPGRAWARLALGRVAELTGELERARDLYRAEGQDAFERRDRHRMRRARDALERVAIRLGQPQRPVDAGDDEQGDEPADG